MVDKTLEYIDYLKLLEVIQTHASTSFTADRISSLRPLFAISDIEERQDRTEDIIEIVKWQGPVPLRDIPDIRTIITRLCLENLSLEAGEFLAIANFFQCCSEIAAFLKKALKRSEFVESIAEGIKPPREIGSLIRKTINPEGYIEDSASYELSKIRADLYQQKEKARRSLDRIMERDEVRPVLQDSYIAIRNSRYVIPLKPNYNQYFHGIVHDYSHSLKTSFVEPMEIIETNNTISVLEKEEKEEEARVLRELTRRIRQYLQTMEQALALISDLDFYHSLALFSSAFRCVRPKVETDGLIDMHGAVNPFIFLSKGERTIPIDIAIGKGKQATIISGPNADGKTVALKTTGLLVAMAATGLFIPAREIPHVHLFPGIYAVMGDEQDISMELSTFTAHVDAIKNVYERCRGGELVLVDEIGGGTEPQEASALAMGTIDAFVEKGCQVIVTTHLNLLKAYGSTRPFALNVATDFEPQTMKPLYRLLYGVAGVSNALKVAEKSGMPQAIVEKSYGYLGKQEYVLNDLIHGLEIEKKEAEEERRKAARYREEARKRVQLLKEKRDDYLKGAEERCRQQIAALEMELEEIRKDLARKDRESLRAGREKIAVIRKRFSPEKKAEQTPIAVGDYVRVRTIGKEGQVTAIDERKKIVDVIVGNMRMRINSDYIEKTGSPAAAKEARVQVNVAEMEVPEINVRGMRVDEALEEVDRFVDRAIVHGTGQVRILHGIGTGRLMSAIRSHLADAGFVKEVRKDEKNSGITIVELA